MISDNTLKLIQSSSVSRGRAYLSLLPIEILASFLEYREVPIQVQRPADTAAAVGMKARMYLSALASAEYLAINTARMIPLLTLSNRE